MEPLTLKSWLESLQSPDAEVRNSAVRASGPMGAVAIALLADMMAAPDKNAARAATQALPRVAHHAARPGARPNEAPAVTAQLLQVAQSASRPRAVRASALDLIGFVGSRDAVPALARLLQDAEVRDDARMALERVPGPESLRALQAAVPQAPADFARALRQSLHARSLSPTTAGTQPMR